MKLTTKHINMEVFRTSPYVYKHGLKDRSYMDGTMKLVDILPDGTMKFEIYDPLSAITRNILKDKEYPERKNYSFTTLENSWNDGNWKVATSDDVLKGIENFDSIASSAFSKTKKEGHDTSELELITGIGSNLARLNVLIEEPFADAKNSAISDIDFSFGEEYFRDDFLEIELDYSGSTSHFMDIFPIHRERKIKDISNVSASDFQFSLWKTPEEEVLANKGHLISYLKPDINMPIKVRNIPTSNKIKRYID